MKIIVQFYLLDEKEKLYSNENKLNVKAIKIYSFYRDSDVVIVGDYDSEIRMGYTSKIAASKVIEVTVKNPRLIIGRSVYDTSKLQNYHSQRNMMLALLGDHPAYHGIYLTNNKTGKDDLIESNSTAYRLDFIYDLHNHVEIEDGSEDFWKEYVTTFDESHKSLKVNI